MLQSRKYLVLALAILAAVVVVIEPAVAQGLGGAGFESKIKGFTNNLMTVILPAVSILGLLYGALLAASGDEGAKRRMTLVIIASVIGFLSPVIIRWFQSAVGG